MKAEEQLKVIKRGVIEIVSEEELLSKLSEGGRLCIKYGADPSRPDLHLGHTVPLRKLRQFQDLGHEVIFLIGDFTATIGDPSGRAGLREPLTRAEVLKNARTYEEQVLKILDKKMTKVVFNSEWLDKMSLGGLVELASKQTVARVLERAEFKLRLEKGDEISILEFFYPLFQAYDSVALKADVEVGGTDQKFNLLMGRTIQRRYGQEPQVVIILPLLEGTDGRRKMSKSYDNYIGVDESPREMFGKTMSISDELMLRYYELLTDFSLSEISKMHPRQAKKKLAGKIVTLYHSAESARKAEEEFENIFQKRRLPDNLKLKTLYVKGDKALLVGLLDIGLALTDSKSEFRRLIQQGGVKVNGQCINDINAGLEAGKEYLI
ncbi:tyrosine--tRNA ligase, partial [candidate division NPL-UPA2 bacterium]|nr:tyrosine--tRNA ligase [candidate division NPL-UPA2 bacterium]